MKIQPTALTVSLLFLAVQCTAAEIYKVHRAGTPITIDGVVTPQEWGSAPTIKNFYRSGMPGKKAHSGTRVYILYDDNNLYIAGVMGDKDVCAVATARDGGIWQDDIFEVFLKPKFSSPHYYEIDTTPNATVYDAFYPKKSAAWARAPQFDAKMNVATKVQGTINEWRDVDQGWTIEEAIPFSSLSETTAPPKPGDIWYFCICRYDYSVYLPTGVELTSSAALRRADFHVYEDYDKLLFQ